MDQPTNETKVQMDIVMVATATGTGADAPPPGQPTSGTATYSMNMDTFVAPSVSGYQEFAQFYRRMAQEVNWMKPPALGIKLDPRVAQGMSELQQNSDALKGFPLLSYVTMTLSATANGQPGDAQTNAQNQQPPNPPPSTTSLRTIRFPPTRRPPVMKGLGGLFGKKKQDNASDSGQGSAPRNPNSNPNSLIEITTQVTSFSDSSLDGGIFDVPAGYTQMQQDAAQVFGGATSQRQQQQTPK